MQPWALVTPASRGIGFVLTRRLLQATSVPVVATARKDVDQAKEKLLEGLKDVKEDRLTVLKLDVTDEASIESASSECSKLFAKDSHYLHLSFAIPGILYPEKSPAQIDAAHALETFQVNTLGPLLLIKHFSKYLPTKKTTISKDASSQGLNPNHATWAAMSARVGSISDNRLGGWYSYRASKAAVNQVVKTFDNYLKVSAGDKAMAIGMHPGTVKTGLSKEFWASTKKENLFEPEWVAERLIDIACGKGDEGANIYWRGKCWAWDGKEVPP